MAKSQDPSVAALRDGLRQAWKHLHKKHPTERVYAFGVYTTPGAEFMMPFACGEEGLARVADRYVKKLAIYKTTEESVKALRWSIADSPYEKDFLRNSFGLDKLFDELDNPLDLSETKMAREVHRRLNAAAEAIKALDAEGLFGKGKQREQLVLLIEAGDREQEWAEKWAKKLNAKKIYDAWAVPPEEPVGTFTEFGTKKVYSTEHFAVNASRSLIAVATHYMYFVFSTKPLKQLAGFGFKGEMRDSPVEDLGLTRDGSLLAIHADGRNGEAGWLVWTHRTSAFKEHRVAARLPARGMSMAIEPNGKWSAVGDIKGQIQIHPPDGSTPAILHSHTGWVRSLALSEAGDRLASADKETLIVWDTATWKPLANIKDSADMVDLDPSGRFVVATRRFGALDRPEPGDRATLARMYDVKTGKHIRDLQVPGFSISVAKFSPDGTQVACAVRGLPKDENDYVAGEEAVLLDAKTSEVIARLKSNFERVNDFAFFPDRGEIAVAVFGHTRRPLVLWKWGK